MATTTNKAPNAGSDFTNLLWVLVPTVAALFVKLIWIVAIAFLAMSYMIRTGREGRWYIWALHGCALLILLRIVGYGFLLSTLGEIPPAFTSKAEYIEKYKPISYLGVQEFSFAEGSIRETADKITKIAEVTEKDIDPFSGKPYLYIDEAGYRTYYSVGPDQKDQKLSVKWDTRQGAFSPGDIPAATVFVGDTATTGTN
ncbi:MAG: hypothetical protein PWP23_2944 [Candidatus Sumerlaeota bacterium]|nr:hypothetical protein [Candidatus Sumerlaeota bacterium]